METQDKQKKEEKSHSKKENKNLVKNLVSLSILLGGLFVGSLFVDVAQMFRSEGFSQKVLNGADVFTLDDKTWVAYDEPMINVEVLTDDSSESCDVSQAILALKTDLPTVAVNKIDINSEEGKMLAEKYEIKSVPFFVFSKEVEESVIFPQAQSVFKKKDDQYLLSSEAIGIASCKYIEAPQINEDDIKIGEQSDDKVTIIQYSDFQCPYCSKMHTTVIEPILKEYGDKVYFVYKQMPLSFHLQANSAALASECANEQGKFLDYANKLFSSQDDWGASKDTQIFKAYARQLGLNATQFNECLDSAKYQDKIDASVQAAQDFGISGTPAAFVGDEFVGGLTTYEDFKALIDEQLNK